jgi:hypothetical protein
LIIHAGEKLTVLLAAIVLLSSLKNNYGQDKKVIQLRCLLEDGLMKFLILEFSGSFGLAWKFAIFRLK